MNVIRGAGFYSEHWRRAAPGEGVLPTVSHQVEGRRTAWAERCFPLPTPQCLAGCSRRAERRGLQTAPMVRSRALVASELRVACKCN